TADAGTVPAHKVYKDLGMDLKVFKEKAAEIGIQVKRAIDKLSEEEIARLRKHLGVAEEPTAAPAKTLTPAEEARKAAEETRQAEAAARQAREDEARRKLEEAERSRLEALGNRLGVPPEHVEFVGQLMGVEINT